jgi:UrcA family protein
MAILVLAAAWQGTALAAPAVDPWNPDPARITVHFGELNLGQPEGAAALYRRIRVAAERVCGEPRLTGSRMVQPDWRACVAQAVSQAVATLDRPTLTAYYRAHTTQSFQDLAVARR